MDNFSPPPLNSRKENPSLSDLLEAFGKDLLLDLNCHAIGTIQTIDYGSAGNPPKVSVKINYKKTYFENTNPQNSEITNFVPVTVDYPALIDCPIYVMQGGGFMLTFPIQVGDTCSVLFNDRDIDRWVMSGQVGAPATNRLHSMSDGIALIGVNSVANWQVTYDTLHALLSKGDTKLGISADKILAKNAAGKSLNDILQNLITVIQGITTTNCVSGFPVQLSPTSISDLNDVASDLGALLE